MVPSDEPPGGRAPPTTYRIEIRGSLPAGLAESLDHFTIHAGPGTTRLTGPLVDTAALYGLIARLEALGLALVCVLPTDRPR